MREAQVTRVVVGRLVPGVGSNSGEGKETIEDWEHGIATREGETGNKKGLGDR